jgi:hypothetical protein
MAKGLRGRHVRASSPREWPPIPVLLRVCRPLAVVGFIIPVHLDTIDRVSGGRLAAHVGQKVLVTVEPSVADLNAAAAVTLEFGGAWVEATLDHASPATIFCCPSTLSSLAVLQRMLRAAATLSVSASKVSQAHHLGWRPAGAPDHDRSVASPRRGVFNYCKFSIALANDR